MNRHFWRAYGLFTGGVIGAGVFGLPAALVASGAIAFGLHLVGVTALAWFVHQSFLDVVTETKGKHRLPGYARLRLAPWAYRVIAGANLLGLAGALVAYLLIGGTFLRLLLEPAVVVSPTAAVVLYLLPGAFLLLKGVRALPGLELVILAVFLLVLVLLPGAAAPHISLENIPLTGSIRGLLLPYGVLLFSFWGVSLVPETYELAGRSSRRTLAVIAAGLATAAACYAIFAGVVASVTGRATTEDALFGLQMRLGDGVVLLALIFGLLTTFSSYLALGLTLLRSLVMDFRVRPMHAWMLTVALPVALIAAGVSSFLEVLALTGAWFLGMEGLGVLGMRHALSRKRRSLPRFALAAAAALLIVGVFGEFLRGVVS